MELDIFDSNQPTRVNCAMMQINATRHNRLENEMFASFLANHLILFPSTKILKVSLLTSFANFSS